jgi:hypothetical protein
VDRADAGELPVEPDVAQEERAGDLVVGVVVKHEAAGVDVTQQHVAFVATAKVAEPRHLPIQSDGAEERSGRNLLLLTVDAFNGRQPRMAMCRAPSGTFFPQGDFTWQLRGPQHEWFDLPHRLDRCDSVPPLAVWPAVTKIVS